MTWRSNLRVWVVISIVLMAFVSPASAKVIYVDANAPGFNNGTSWEDAYKYLQDALADADSAAKPVEIHVAEGIYRPDETSANPNGSGDHEATFQLINEAAIKGGYAGFGEPDANARDIGLYETILSGDLVGNDIEVDDLEYLLYDPCRVDNSYRVVTGSWTDVNAMLDGFTITAGNNSIFLATEGGAGMYIYEGSATITNCTFSYNAAINKGGGMLNINFLSGCDYCNPKIENCTFIYNCGRSGGGMYNWESNPTISNCKFIGNIAENGRGGGMRNLYSHPILTNCLFIRNSAEFGGGGMANGQSSPELTNCTFSGNSGSNGGGMENNQSNPVLTNCILWGNINGQIQGSAIVSYSDIQGGCPGLGNIDADPCFADAVNSDYHLKSQAGRWDANSQSWVRDDVTSPCIDAGNPGCPVGDEPAPNGNRRNMGAYGGTAEASKSPTYWRSIADLTNDWVVDSNDLKVFVDYWLQMGECIPSDLDRDQNVDFADFALLSGSWPQVQNSDCLPHTLPEYPLWVALGKPLCWCYPRQCHGDADGQKTGLWWVGTTDLSFFRECYFHPVPLPLPGCECADFNRDGQVDELDAAIIEAWLYVIDVPADCGGTLVTEPSMTYEIGDCIPVDLGSSAAEETGETRFTVTVEDSNIHFEDMMRANCCPVELEVQMTVEEDLITIYEIEHTPMPCPCMCDFPITATLGPFEPGTYILEVYQNSGFIGSTTVTIENDQ